MKISLVGPSFEDNLSVRYLASPLIEAGHEVRLLPFDGPDDRQAVIDAARGTDLVGLSLCFQVRAAEFFELARMLQAAGVPTIVAGGHFATCAAEQILADNPAIDLIVLHEGEHTLVEVAERGADPELLQDVPGLALRRGGQIVRTAKRPILEDLDTLPFPDRRGPVHLFAGVPSAYMLGSRGCVASCDYCCITTLHRTAPGRRFRRRDPERIADEMAGLYHERGVRQFIFHDDNFLVPSVRHNHARLDALERAFEARGLRDIGIVLKCRPPDVERSVFARLRGMGLLRVFLGVESSSEEGLCSIGRRQTVAQSEEALALCAELGISAQYTMMCFHPDATLETLRSDIAFMRRHIDHAINFCRTETYAGTPLLQRMEAEGRATGDYLAKTYTIADARVQRASDLAMRLFADRCWAMGGLMERVIGLDHLSAVVDRFYARAETLAVREDIRRWRLDANHELVDQLELLVETSARASGLSDPALRAQLRQLAGRERAGRRELLSRGRRLHVLLDAAVLERVGLVRDAGLRPAPRVPMAGLARHAAAVLLALAAGTVSNLGCSEYAPPPLMDTDGDGLPDQCEREIFGTNPNSTDTDGDGTPDGQEDHDGDGLTNRQEQARAGGVCADIVGPGPDAG